MKPPVCDCCHQHVDAVASRTGLAGGLVAFADHRPLPDGMVGHPHGLAWFCGEHLADAMTLRDRTLDVAIAELRRRSALSKRLPGNRWLDLLKRTVERIRGRAGDR